VPLALLVVYVPFSVFYSFSAILSIVFLFCLFVMRTQVGKAGLGFQHCSRSEIINDRSGSSYGKLRISDPDPGNHLFTDPDPDPTCELQIDKKRHNILSRFF